MVVRRTELADEIAEKSLTGRPRAKTGGNVDMPRFTDIEQCRIPRRGKHFRTIEMHIGIVAACHQNWIAMGGRDEK